MKFVLVVDCDNAAFSEDAEADRRGTISEDGRVEVARILGKIAEEMVSGADDFSAFRTLRDSNGNDVGRAAFKREATIQTS